MRATALRSAGAVLLLGALLAALLPRPGFAGEVDSLGATPPMIAVADTIARGDTTATADTTSASPPHITVELEGDPTVVAALVFWRSDGYIAVVSPNGSELLVGTHKVRKVLDETGRDRTHFVIEKHGAVGVVPPAYQGHVDSTRFLEKKGISNLEAFGVGLLIIGAIVGIVVLLSVTSGYSN
jgi:hypothetical protein